MANWKKVFRQYPPSNGVLAETLKSGTKAVILECEMLAVNKDGELSPCVKIKGCPHWIRLNKTACILFDDKYGEETEDWIGKKIEIKFTKGSFPKNGSLILSVIPL